MADVKAVIRSAVAHAVDAQQEGIPLQATYFFPPFPSEPPGRSLRTFADWQQSGVYIPIAPTASSSGWDVRDVRLIPDKGTGDARSNQIAEERARDKKLRHLQKAKLGVRVLREDCWKIGEDDSDWVEPDGTSRSDFDPSIPPFTRLLSITRDFLNSRHEEFQFMRTKRFMDSIRNAFGIRANFGPEHCKGSGPEGMDYVPPSSLRIKDITPPIQKALADGPSAEEEICPLLREPVVCVRGFMALVRRDGEAGWDIEPALKLARILSAFICFIHHYNVVPELADALLTCTKLARRAVRQIQEAKNIEDILGSGQNLNRAMWIVHGGQWSGAERGGLEKEARTSTPVVQVDDASDGGWEVEILPDMRPEVPKDSEARPALHTYLAPMDLDRIRMLGYIPFSRRKVVSILPPLAASPGQPRFMQTLYRLVTAAAPWTLEERWRARSTKFSDSEDEEDDASEDDMESFALEKEHATVDEPETLEIWCEVEQFAGGRPESIIGVGLRGRWAIMGVEGGHQWWTFKAKDFILPAFWQS